MRRSAAGDSKRSDSDASPHKQQMMERGDAGHAPDARRDHGALGHLDLAEAPPALELHHARAPGDGERAHQEVQPVVLEQPDHAAVVAVLAHRHRQPRQRQHVADEGRPRDELVDAGAQRLLAPPALADGDHRQLARHRLLAQPADDRAAPPAPSTATTTSCGTRVCAMASASSPSRVA